MRITEKIAQKHLTLNLNTYIEISIDANEYFNSITGRMQWEKLWIAFTKLTYDTLLGEIEEMKWEEVYDRTIALRKSVFSDLKKYYRRNKKLYIIGISIKR